jgi:preprotein translocase subunit SecA
LGGNWEAEFEKIPGSDDSTKSDTYEKWKEQNNQVIESGGLHVIGTERNESRRMDNQLGGRSGRQGDPGSSRFYISLEDSLMRIFASDQFKNIMQRVGLEKGESIEHRMLTGAIERAQKRVEGRNFDIRKMLLEYDDMANEQRQIIYSQRNSILEADVITDLIDSMRESVISNEVSSFTPENASLNEGDITALETSITNIFGLQIPIDGWVKENSNLNRELLIERIQKETKIEYKAKGDSIGPVMRDFEKQILLQIIDNSWKDHLSAVDALRQGIGLRSYASKNPKLEFRRESFDLFEKLLEKIRHEGIRFLSRVEIESSQAGALANKKETEKETYQHHEAMSSFDNGESNSTKKNPSANQAPGNRRLRRAEAKMARKKGKK